MELKEGYKQTEIGVIPEDWETKCIDKEIDLLTGFPFPSKDYSQSGIRLLRGSNVKRGVTDWSEDNTQYWRKVTSELKPYILECGDIVIAMDGSMVGKSFARLTTKDLPALLLQRVARIRSTKIDLGYLKEFTCSTYFTKYCDTVKTSSAIPHISPKDIRGFSIPLPPTLFEQTAIATVLSDTDALISSLEKLIVKKANIKQGAMQKLLQPKEGWVVKTYGETFDFLTTANYSRAELSESDDVKYIHYGDIHTRWNSFLNVEKNFFPTVKNEQVKNFPFIKEGDIIMADASEDYAGIGKSVEVKNLGGTKIISGLHTFLLRDSNNIFINGFKGYIHSCKIVKEQFDKLATGLKVYGVSKNNLKMVQIPIPPKSEQMHIASILSDMDAEIAALETKLEKYRKIKLGMMQELLTGKIRLNH